MHVCVCDRLNRLVLEESTLHTEYTVLHFNEAVVMGLLDNDGVSCVK